jgi:hypothetical protein
MAQPKITIRDLNAVCERINRLTESPMASYAKSEEGKFIAQVGNYHISQEYGGYSLHRMYNEGGGVSTVFHTGHVPARELYEKMHSFIAGYDAACIQHGVEF